MKIERGIMSKVFWGFVGRYTFVHLMVFWIAGMFLHQLWGSEAATMDIFKLYRPVESFSMFAVMFFGQVLRGGIIAMMIYPFYREFKKYLFAWVILFGLLFGLNVMGSPVFMISQIDFITLERSVEQFTNTVTAGMPQIFIKTIFLTFIFGGWEMGRKSVSGDGTNLSQFFLEIIPRMRTLK